MLRRLAFGCCILIPGLLAAQEAPEIRVIDTGGVNASTLFFLWTSENGSAAFSNRPDQETTSFAFWSEEFGMVEPLPLEDFTLSFIPSRTVSSSGDGFFAIGAITTDFLPQSVIVRWTQGGGGNLVPVVVTLPEQIDNCGGDFQRPSFDGSGLVGTRATLAGESCRLNVFGIALTNGTFIPLIDRAGQDVRMGVEEITIAGGAVVSFSNEPTLLVAQPGENPIPHPATAEISARPNQQPTFCMDGESVLFVDFTTQPFTRTRWNPQTGAEIIAPGVPLSFDPRSGVSADGKVIAGSSGFLWRSGSGLVDLRDYLLSFDPTLPYESIAPTAVSPDGRVIFARATLNDGLFTNVQIQIKLPAVVENTDSDGDGLLDEWEREGGGIDVDGDGIVEYSLFALGARVDRKDLFLEIDTLPGNELPAAGIAQLVQAFEDAPESIALHIDATETGLIAPGTVTSVGWPPICDTLKQQHFLSPAERALPNADKLRQAKARFSRYMLVFDDTEGGKLAGRAKAIPSNDLYICLGPGRRQFPNPADFATYVASKIMHEFGHTLGLYHGGAINDTINGKPNYISVMNYALHDRTKSNRTFWRLDYSRAELPPINEGDINEVTGLQGGALYRNYRMPVATGGPGGTRVPKLIPLNGRRFDVGDRDESSGQPDGLFTAGVAQDLNYFAGAAETFGSNPSPDQPMVGHDDWANLKYAVPLDDLRTSAVNPPEELPWEPRFLFFDSIEPYVEESSAWFLH